MLRELFELRGAGVDQFIQRSLHFLQVSELFPQGAGLLPSASTAFKYISNPTRTHRQNV